jgi:hypothetical protein
VVPRPLAQDDGETTTQLLRVRVVAEGGGVVARLQEQARRPPDY